MRELVERLLDHAALHETVLGQCGDDEQRQWAEDLREVASQIVSLRNDADRMLARAMAMAQAITELKPSLTEEQQKVLARVLTAELTKQGF